MSLEMWECLCYCLEMQLEDDLLKLAHDAFFFSLPVFLITGDLLDVPLLYPFFLDSLSSCNIFL